MLQSVDRICVRAILAMIVVLNLFGLSVHAGPPVATTDPLPPDQQQKKFKLPDGFEIQLVAAEPEIQKPMNLAFDSRGRLWVSHSIEYPWAAEDPEKSRDAISILEDIGSDGRARKVTRFAEKLNIPIGVLPMPNGREAIVWSIPNIWKLTDTDGDGKADKREVLYGPFDFVDTHGNQNAFRLGNDGWIYACHGFRNASQIKLRGEGPVVLEMQSGNTYRFRPDGSAIEQLSWGQVNPFGQCIDYRGDTFTADCHSKPITLILRGGYYDSFGKPHDGLGFAPIATSDDHGSTGIAGIIDYAASHFPAEYQHSMFVGNVVTNIVHRDRPQWRGSSPWIEKPEDFLTCSDWWFHPVDLQLGPDGALYISDFYNSIIGHYEVDLKHPARDRTRGRVWRVVYTGKQQAAPVPPNLNSQDFDQLVTRLSDANLTVRQFAINEIEQRFKDGGLARGKERVAQAAVNENERVQWLWFLWRQGQLTDSLANQLTKDPSALVRIHLVKAFAESADWTAAQAGKVRAATVDADPFVRRASAEALGRHPDLLNVKPLIQLWNSAPPEDVQLIQATRIALRNQVRSPGLIDQIAKAELTGAELARVSEIALAVPTESAAGFTFQHIQKNDLSQVEVEKGLAHVAKNVSPKQLDEVADYVQKKFASDPAKQMTLFQSMFDGLNQRGVRLVDSSVMGQWATKLAKSNLAPREPRPARWHNVPLAAAPTNSPWGVRKRSCDDGQEAMFFDSIVHGEQLTGILRSAPFVLPNQVSFWVCGHNGSPGTNPAPVNHVRLKLVATGEIVAQEIPPRNDAAKQVTWDVSKWAGQTAVIEAVDADTGGSYAWLAVGRFSPAVITSPTPGYAFVDSGLVTAVQIADQLKLKEYDNAIVELLANSNVDTPVRTAAASAGLNLAREKTIEALAKITQSADEPNSLRTQAAQLLGSVNTNASRDALATALRSAPAPLQQPIALTLAGTAEGAELLFNVIASGKASARLLQDKPVLDRLASVAIPEREQKIKDLTRGLPAPDERLKTLVAQFSAHFQNSDSKLEAGEAVFKKTCANCHRINDQGGKVGPQLDGVGQRGLERLLEDILDPNRNVDGAFRATVIEKKDGLVVTGLKLRDDGPTIVLADNQGKEVTVRGDDIEEVRVSNLSPMPSNFADQLNEKDLQSLLTYLLRQKQAAKAH